MFGVLQMLHFAEQHGALCNEMFLYSIKEQVGFPFAIVSFGFSALCIQLARESVLSNISINILNNAYTAIFYEFFIIWKTGKTIIDFDAVKKQLASTSKQNINAIMQNFLHAK